jgi:DUF917 family protein
MTILPLPSLVHSEARRREQRRPALRAGVAGTYCDARKDLSPTERSVDRGRLRPFAEPEIDFLATGAWILGTGGGGDPYYNYLNLKKLYRDGKRIELLDPLALDDDDLVAVVSFQGAPLVSAERLPDPVYACKAVTVMQDYLGRRFTAIMSAEIGGSNGLQPFLPAALLGIPVIDADAMGRAFPDVSKTCFAIRDLEPTPLTVIDVRGNSVIIPKARDWFWAERISRKATTEMGSISSTCKAPRTGREVKEHGILHTVTQALEIGRVVHEARRRHEDPIAAVLASQGGELLFRGKVHDIARRTTEGFLRGAASIEGLDENKGQTFRLEFQNEFSVGCLDGEVLITVPDLICVLDTVSGEAIGTETLRYGQRVSVIALPSPEIFLSRKGIFHTGPRAFGFDLEFRSYFGREIAA